MNKKTIISLVIIFAGVISLVWWSKSIENREVSAKELPKSLSAGTGNALSMDKSFYDFGTISMKNGKVSTIFRVTNPTTEDIKVPSVSTSCMCTNAFIIKEDGSKSRPYGMPGHGGSVPKANAIIGAGGVLDIEVEYDPNAHGPAGVGLIERSVFLEDEKNNVIEFKVKVNVTP